MQSDRYERIRGHVLNAITDDYEAIEQILEDLRTWHPELAASEAEVIAALRDIVGLRWAKAYRPNLTGYLRVVDGVPDAETCKFACFLITQQGRRALDLLPEAWFPEY